MQLLSSSLVAAALAAPAALLFAPPVGAWWDTGHMLVGEVATQLMAPEDVGTIERVLRAWRAEFPNTENINTAAIWPDLVKCNKKSAFCDTDSVPSFSAMDKWHYINLPLFANGAPWGNGTADFGLFKESFDGEAPDILDKMLTTFNTTKSLWSANLALRQFIHIVGDLHQPMHAVGAVSDKYPRGDLGGNLYKFQQPCVATNLHALYDAAGGELVNNWGPSIDSFKPQLQANATELIGLLPGIADPLDLAKYERMDYSTFLKTFTADQVSKQIALDSYRLATTFVYANINVTFTGDVVPCPSAEYVSWVTHLCKLRIALGGKHLASLLTHVAGQLRFNGLDKSSDPHQN